MDHTGTHKAGTDFQCPECRTTCYCDGLRHLCAACEIVEDYYADLALQMDAERALHGYW